MSKESHNLAESGNATKHPGSHNGNSGFSSSPDRFSSATDDFEFETFCQSVLRIRTPKEWARDIGVSRQKVSAWANGEPIPKQRRFQIVRVAKSFFMDQHRLEDEIDRILLEQYGPADKGRF